MSAIWEGVKKRATDAYEGVKTTVGAGVEKTKKAGKAAVDIVYTPVEIGSEKTGAKLAAGAFGYIKDNQTEISLVCNQLFSDILFAEAPEEYTHLLEKLDAFAEKARIRRANRVISQIHRCLELEEDNRGIKSKVPKEFFTKIEELLESLNACNDFAGPRNTITTTPVDMKKVFRKAGKRTTELRALLKITLANVSGVWSKFQKKLIEEGFQNPRGVLHTFYDELSGSIDKSVRSATNAFFSWIPGIEGIDVAPASKKHKSKSAKAKNPSTSTSSSEDVSSSPALKHSAKKKDTGKDKDKASRSYSTSTSTSTSSSEEEELDPSSAIPSSDPASSSTKKASSFSFEQLKTQATHFLRSFVHFSGSTIAIQAARALAQLFQMALKYLSEESEKDPKKKYLLASIEPLMKQLEEAIEEESWDSLKKAIQNSITLLQQHRIYVSGFHIPFLDFFNPQPNQPSIIPDLFDTIDRHQLALNPKGNANPLTISRQMIREQIAILREKFSAFTPLSIIEKIVNLPTDGSLQEEVFKPTSDSSDRLANLYRNRLFTKIDQSSSNFFMKWLGKALYRPLHTLSSFYTGSITKNLTDAILSLIKTDKKNPNGKQDWIINTSRESLALLSGAYTEAGESSASKSKDLDLMMEEVLKIPERNGGLSEEALFKAAIQTVFDAFGPKITWTQSIESYLSKEIPTTSPFYFLNPVAKWVQFLASRTLKVLLFIPQWLANKCLQGVTKIGLRYTSGFHEYVKEKMESMQQDTPASYALQKMIYRHMRELLEATQKNLKTQKKKHNLGEKIRISGLVHHALDVLEKGACRTQDQLKKQLKGKSPLREWLHQQAEDNVRPEIIENAITPISVALEAFTEESQLKKILYDSLFIANESFSKQKKVSTKDFVSLQEATLEMIDKMIETVIRDAVEKNIDFTNTKQLKGLQKYMKKFKKRTDEFCATLKHTSQKVMNCKNLTTIKLKDQIAKLLEKSIEFHRESIDALGGAYGESSPFDLSTVRELNAMQKQLSDYMTPLIKQLNELQKRTGKMLESYKIRTIADSGIEQIVEIDNTLQKATLSKQDISDCKKSLGTLENLSEKLNDTSATKKIKERMNLHCENSGIRLKTIQSMQDSNEILKNLYPLLKTLPKNQSEQEYQFQQEIEGLPSKKQRDQLKRSLYGYVTNQISQVEFLRQIKNFYIQNETVCRKLKNRHELEKNSLCEILKKTANKENGYLKKDKIQLKNRLRKVSEEAEQIQRWTQGQEGPVLWSILDLDTPWIIQAVKTFAFKRAQAKSRVALEALWKKYNYEFLFNRSLVSLIKAFGKHHLKSS